MLNYLYLKCLQRFWHHASALRMRWLRFRALVGHRSKVMRILFGEHKDREPLIRSGFAGSPHEIVFRPLQAGGLKDFDLVVPLTVDDVLFLDSQRESLAASPLPLPEREVVELCDDKPRLNRLLAESCFAALTPAQGTRTYPYILKKRVDEWGRNCHMVFSPGDEVPLARKLADSAYFTEELVPGNTEYATHILMQEGEAVFALTVKYVFPGRHCIKGRDPYFYTRLSRTRFTPEFQSVLRFIGFNGLCCVNYKLRNERPVILEINPRFGASLCPYFSLLMEAAYAKA